MTPQQIEALKLALEALEGFYEYGYDRQECFEHITAIKEALLEHAMSEVQRLGQEIEQCQCTECQIKPHASDCAVHSEPAYPKGKCDCGAQPEQEPVIDGNTSDGYHTFNELYEFRKAYNIALFNEWAANGKCSVHKSWRHDDGELCFGGGWFIVVAVLPQGQISNHYEAKDWDLFHIQETGKALFEFDGHTGADVIERLKSYTAPPQRTWVGLTGLDQKELMAMSARDAVFATEAKLKERNQ